MIVRVGRTFRWSPDGNTSRVELPGAVVRGRAAGYALELGQGVPLRGWAWARAVAWLALEAVVRALRGARRSMRAHPRHVDPRTRPLERLDALRAIAAFESMRRRRSPD